MNTGMSLRSAEPASCRHRLNPPHEGRMEAARSRSIPRSGKQSPPKPLSLALPVIARSEATIAKRSGASRSRCPDPERSEGERGRSGGVEAISSSCHCDQPSRWLSGALSLSKGSRCSSGVSKPGEAIPSESSVPKVAVLGLVEQIHPSGCHPH